MVCHAVDAASRRETSGFGNILSLNCFLWRSGKDSNPQPADWKFRLIANLRIWSFATVLSALLHDRNGTHRADRRRHRILGRVSQEPLVKCDQSLGQVPSDSAIGKKERVQIATSAMRRALARAFQRQRRSPGVPGQNRRPWAVCTAIWPPRRVSTPLTSRPACSQILRHSRMCLVIVCILSTVVLLWACLLVRA